MANKILQSLIKGSPSWRPRSCKTPKGSSTIANQIADLHRKCSETEMLEETNMYVNLLDRKMNVCGCPKC